MALNTCNIASSNNFSVSKVNVKSGCIYVKLMWEKNPSELFTIQIFESDNSSWTGTFSCESANQCRESFDHLLGEDQYKLSVKEALIGIGSSYVFDFDAIKGQFRWKKKFPDALVEHGRVSVQKDEVPTSIHTLIDVLLEQNHALLNIIHEYSKSQEGLETELEICKRELDNFVDTKISLEETIYGKFLQLLNEKKKRITMLDEAIKSME